jgi:hypothetical protein
MNLLRCCILGALVACNGKDDTGEALGEYTTDTGGLTEDIPFAVPNGSASAVVYCGPYGDALLGTAWEIRDADGNYIYTNENHPDHAATKMRVGNLDDLLPVLMPVSPDLDLESGDHTMKVWVASGGTPQTFPCDAIYRTGSVSSTGTIDLHIVFVGTDVTEATAPDDEDFSTVLAHVRKWWGAGGLEVGDINYGDFSGDVDKYSVVDADTEFNDLLRTTDADGDVLTIFMVQEITSSSGGTILGLSAGPPGLPTVSGTSKSGMVVTTADLHEDPVGVGRTIAHEGAHFLGLFHTSEKTGSVHDPLSDTPECNSADDANSNGQLEPSECPDGDNLMFWGQSDAADLSDDQSWVLGRNPAVY